MINDTREEMSLKLFKIRALIGRRHTPPGCSPGCLWCKIRKVLLS